MPRRSHVEFDSTIKAGLPVIVEANIHPSEPDVGIFTPQVEITGIFWLPRRRSGAVRWKQKRRPVPETIYNHAMVHDLEHLEQEALEAASD